MKVDYLKIAGVVAIIIIVFLLGWASYNYYFKKPIPVVNNYTAPVTQVHNEIKAKQHLLTSIYIGRNGNANEFGGSVGWLW
jgi:hypothetical protein